MRTSGRRLIEEVLPIQAVSAQSSREKSIRHGHISTLHIWWARRPLAACRAAVLGALLRDPGPGKLRDELVGFLERYCSWEGGNDLDLIGKARKLVIENSVNGAPKLLDCFAGGGAIPLEALRAGCAVYSLELNPVAVLIELCTLVYPQKFGGPAEVETQQKGLQKNMVVPNRLAYDLATWGRWVLDETRKEIGRFYPSDREGRIPVAHLWARTVTCPNPKCGAQVPLVRQLWLANKSARKIALKMQLDHEERGISFRVVEGKGIDFNPKEGTMRYGSLACPLCRQTPGRDFLYAEGKAGRIGQRMLAVVTVDGDRRKAFRVPTDADVEKVREAERYMNRRASRRGRDAVSIPDEEIPRGWPRTILVPLYGIHDYGQLFNPRQALVLVTFATKIREVYHLIRSDTENEEYARALTTYLGLLLDRVADYTNTLSRWDNTQERNVNIFSRQAMPMIWDYSELNPLARAVGSWEPMLEAAVRVIENVSLTGEPASVSQGTATKLPYPDGYFEAVVTDPPYYNAVPYADLSDFFYVWLKRTVGQLYPSLFGTPLTPKTPEIVEQMPHSSIRKRKDKQFFETEMAKAFREMHRVLRSDGVCTVVFAHKTTTAWETLIRALIDAGFLVSASWPLHTEMATRLRARGSAALASSTWLVCRKRDLGAPPGSWKEVQVELEDRVKERMDTFLKQGIRGADALLSAIGPALEVFGRYAKVEKVTGEQVTVAEFLDKVREVVSRHALASVLEGHEMGAVDPITAFYVLWKWSYEAREEDEASHSSPESEEVTSDQEETSEGEKDTEVTGGKTLVNLRIPADDAFKLARSVGAEFDDLIRPGGILRKDKEYAVLLGPQDRRRVAGLGEQFRDGRPSPIIDLVHRAIRHWIEGDHAALEDYLDASGARSREAFWTTISALSRILQLDSPEKRQVDGLWSRYGRGPMESAVSASEKAQTTLEGFGRET